MEDFRVIAELNVAEADAILKGVVWVLDALEDELCANSRYYALMSCLGDVIEKLGVAAEAIDKLRSEAEKPEQD
jgi:hypothetical protein